MGVSPSANGGPALIGQMRYTPGDRSAHLAFVLPDFAAASSSLTALMEYFAVQAGRRGAFHLLAELEENHPAFESMRRAGFSVYAWQRIWSCSVQRSNGERELSRWRPVRPVDETHVRSLYQSLIPPLVQAAEPLPEHISRGLVYRKDDEVLAYVEGVYGPRAIILFPLVHPGVEDVTGLLGDLLQNLPSRLGRPVYLAVRSYQAWLEGSLQQMDMRVAPRQALMVKHLVNPQRVGVLSPRYSVLENPQAEPTASIVHSIYNSGAK